MYNGNVQEMLTLHQRLCMTSDINPSERVKVTNCAVAVDSSKKVFRKMKYLAGAVLTFFFCMNFIRFLL